MSEVEISAPEVTPQMLKVGLRVFLENYPVNRPYSPSQADRDKHVAACSCFDRAPGRRERASLPHSTPPTRGQQNISWRLDPHVRIRARTTQRFEHTNGAAVPNASLDNWIQATIVIEVRTNTR